MKIAIAQINTCIGDLESNITKIIYYYNNLKKSSDLVVFPELVVSSYPLIDLLEREDFVNKQLLLIEEKLLPIVGDAALIIGAITKNKSSGKKYFNSALFIYKGKIKKIINKKLLPNYELFDEKRYFEAGKTTQTINFKSHKLGISVCEDMWKSANTDFDKLYSKDPILELKEADILINISASPYSLEKNELRHKLISKYSKNKTFIFVNAVGANDSIVFDGKSKIYTNQKLQHECLGFLEDTFIFDTNDKIKVSRICDENKDILAALTLGLKDYISKNNLEGVVIGLSGGIDSAICTYLAVKALGPDKVKCITMPSEYSSLGSVNDSKKLCENLNVKLYELPITSVLEASKSSFIESLNFEIKNLALENIQSRIRALFLNAYANSFNGYVLIATGNKSEIATGYCTLYGDTCGALALIGDVYKTKIYELAHYINKDDEIIPNNIITKAPSAELKFNQTDQDSLPPYEMLDAIIKLYVEENKTSDELIKLFDANIVYKVIKLINASEFKRRQMAPIVKISKKAFNIDRRWAIVNKYY